MKSLSQLSGTGEPYSSNVVNDWVQCEIEEYIDCVRLRIDVEQNNGVVEIDIPFLKHVIRVIAISKDEIEIKYNNVLFDEIAHICGKLGITWTRQNDLSVVCSRDNLEDVVHSFIRIMIANELLWEYQTGA